MERLFREYSTDVVCVWSPVDLHPVLRSLSPQAKSTVELRADGNRRKLPQKSPQHFETGKQYDMIDDAA